MIEKPNIFTHLETFENLHDAYDSKIVQLGFRFEYTEWLLNLCEWRNFITLTYRYDVSEETANRQWQYLLKELNKKLFGNSYTRRVGHSYFSYILTKEYTKNDRIHFHAITDRPLDYILLHNVWQKMGGFAQVQRIVNPMHSISYVLKYVLKDGDIQLYLKKEIPQPLPRPYWWIE